MEPVEAVGEVSPEDVEMDETAPPPPPPPASQISVGFRLATYKKGPDQDSPIFSDNGFMGL